MVVTGPWARYQFFTYASTAKVKKLERADKLAFDAERGD